ncbi:YpmS family protein [Paraliobacillus salinarum]|uniref:YpmS family protein n=1 Tax=Paraliobacillus salinarum TaxID=1158996 RepID=UPI0015F66D50|nr:YpmS family protein [Paraliobacillus salinarum]
MKQTAQRHWKKLFIGLLSLNLLVITIIFILIFSPAPDLPVEEKQITEEKAGAQFTVQSSKKNLSQLVNGYLDEALNDKKGKYSVQFEEDVQFNGSVQAFSKDIPVSISMEPIVQENGDLILQQKEMSLGLLLLPKNKILEYVEKQVGLPEWIRINPKKEQIYVAVTEIDIKSNFKIRIQQFDLENDRLSFRIKVPTESLGF